MLSITRSDYDVVCLIIDEPWPGLLSLCSSQCWALESCWRLAKARMLWGPQHWRYEIRATCLPVRVLFVKVDLHGSEAVLFVL